VGAGGPHFPAFRVSRHGERLRAGALNQPGRLCRLLSHHRRRQSRMVHSASFVNSQVQPRAVLLGPGLAICPWCRQHGPGAIPVPTTADLFALPKRIAAAPSAGLAHSVHSCGAGTHRTAPCWALPQVAPDFQILRYAPLWHCGAKVKTITDLVCSARIGNIAASRGWGSGPM